MSWIKDNQFIAVLGGITLVGAAGLIVFGLQGSSRYQAALDSYTELSNQANTSESLELYPTTSNSQGKRKAVVEYRDAVTGLQNDFGKFRPATLESIPPQEFTNRLKLANTEVLTAFEQGKTTVPGQFFSGFETYTGTLAREGATGILNYELGASKELFLALAKAAPSQLYNVYRQRLPEEDGTAWTAPANEVARPLSFEVSFKATEKAARDFLSSIAKSDQYYYVIRSLKITNEKKTPPLVTDAKFEAPPAAPAPETAPSAGFVLPGDAAAPAAEAPAAAAPEAAPVEPAPADTGRILSQVLGGEEVMVFVRLDVLQFLPAKELPQP